MRHQPATTAPSDCGSCGAADELVPVTDPGGSALLCRLCVIALVGSTTAPVALLLGDPVAPTAGLCQWLCGAPECKRSGCQNR